MSKNQTSSIVVILGFTLFALFFGAGNLIFPVMLGQMSGTNVWIAVAGFIVTGVGLPLLGVLAFSFAGSGDLRTISNRVHPVFGLVFTTTLYLAIGPLFAIPRTGTVSYEVGIKPFITNVDSPVPLAIFTVLFFGITCYFSLNSSKIVDLMGKVLTPLLLTSISILIITALLNPVNRLYAPVDSFEKSAFFKGFQEGYLTMDALASFVFGIFIIQAIREKGITEKKQAMVISLKAALLAAALLAIIYASLAYIGAGSVATLGYLENGGLVISRVAELYFGSFGQLLLGGIVVAACLTTSVGLITSCASYFHQLIPAVSYRKFAILFSLLSGIFANVGLTELISISVPVLTTIYPVAIVLMVLVFLNRFIDGKSNIYLTSIVFTLFVSIFDGLTAAEIHFPVINHLFSEWLPLYDVGLGWTLPAIIGGLIGSLIEWIKSKKHFQYKGITIQKNTSYK